MTNDEIAAMYEAVFNHPATPEHAIIPLKGVRHISQNVPDDEMRDDIKDLLKLAETEGWPEGTPIELTSDICRILPPLERD